jgi:hypothetical protein
MLPNRETSVTFSFLGRHPENNPAAVVVGPGDPAGNLALATAEYDLSAGGWQVMPDQPGADQAQVLDDH